MTKIKAVLFDIDGTLMDTNRLHIQAWVQAFKHSGYSLSDERIAEEIGKGGDKLVPSVLGEPQSKADEEEQDRIRQAHDDEYQKIADQAKPFPAARDILASVRKRGVKVALATSASDEEVERYVEQLDADRLVDVITNKADVEESKPAPDIFAVALKKLGLKADEAVAVGDTPYDIIASCQLDLPCVGVLSGGFSREQLMQAGAIAIFDSVAHLQDHLDNLLQLSFD